MVQQSAGWTTGVTLQLAVRPYRLCGRLQVYCPILSFSGLDSKYDLEGKAGCKGNGKGTRWNHHPLNLLLAGLTLLWCVWWVATAPRVISLVSAATGMNLPYMRKDTLVLYVHSETDPQFHANLEYFIKEGMSAHDRCDYLIVVQQSNMSEPLPHLPTLPPNARILRHPNECYDWGTFGWAMLRSGAVNWHKYRYFVFLNSSIRGPFFPAYLRSRMHWTKPLLEKVTSEVKLVGSTINCAGSPKDGKQDGEWRRNPHVQSCLVATDQVGLKVMLNDGQIFKCHSNRWDAIFFAELGSSKAILDAGYNLDSLMIRYQGVDWRDKASWECNSKLNPMNSWFFDGVSIDPLETLFVKVKTYLLDYDLEFAQKAQKYTQWQSEVDANMVMRVKQQDTRIREMTTFKAAKIVESAAKGPECFDFSFYLDQNPDVRPLPNAKEIWKHFIFWGQFELRNHRFLCQFNTTDLAHRMMEIASA